MTDKSSSPVQPKDSLLKESTRVFHDQEERDRLLSYIRASVLADSETPIDPTDILNEEVKLLSTEELKCVVDNINAFNAHKDRGYFGSGVLKVLNFMVENFSLGAYTLESGLEDHSLVSEMDGFLMQYTGSIPGVGKLVIKLLAHFKQKRIISQSQENVEPKESTAGGSTTVK
jgi:hypothetical protein